MKLGQREQEIISVSDLWRQCGQRVFLNSVEWYNWNKYEHFNYVSNMIKMACSQKQGFWCISNHRVMNIRKNRLIESTNVYNNREYIVGSSWQTVSCYLHKQIIVDTVKYEKNQLRLQKITTWKLVNLHVIKYIKYMENIGNVFLS